MLLTDKIIAIKNADIFSSLSQGEILHIADVAKYFSFKKDEAILKKGNTPPYLVLVIGGLVSAENGSSLKSDGSSPVLLGASNILLDIECGQSWLSAGDETEVLLIEKSHFFTILYQCPQIVTFLLERNSAHTRSIMPEVL